jgi:hypothetical protein
LTADTTLRAESFVGRVEIYRGSELVARHARSYVRGAVVLELAHYLGAFARKPRAALSCAALAGADPVFLRARDLALAAPDGHRRFAEILLLGRELGLARLAAGLVAGALMRKKTLDGSEMAALVRLARSRGSAR